MQPLEVGTLGAPTKPNPLARADKRPMKPENTSVTWLFDLAEPFSHEEDV